MAANLGRCLVSDLRQVHGQENKNHIEVVEMKIDEKTELMMLRIRVKNLEKQLKELKK